MTSSSLAILVMAALAACGDRGHGVVATPVVRSEPVAAVEWDARARVAVCRRTATTLPIPGSWRARAVGPDELVFASDTGVVAVVRSGMGAPAATELLRDVADIHRLATGASPAAIDVRDAVIEGDQLRVRYTTDDGDHWIVYRIIVRSGASCRIAALSPAGRDDPAARALVAGAVSAGWAEYDQAVAPRGDPAWALLRGVLVVGTLAIPGK